MARLGFGGQVFIADKGGLDKICTSAAAKDLCAQVAQEGADLARRDMPVDTGYEKSQIFSSDGPDEDGSATAKFGSRSSTWHLVEYGSAHNVPRRVFRRAAERLGIKFKEEPA